MNSALRTVRFLPKAGEVFQGLEEHEWEQGWVHPSLVSKWGEGNGG